MEEVIYAGSIYTDGNYNFMVIDVMGFDYEAKKLTYDIQIKSIETDEIIKVSEKNFRHNYKLVKKNKRYLIISWLKSGHVAQFICDDNNKISYFLYESSSFHGKLEEKLKGLHIADAIKMINTKLYSYKIIEIDDACPFCKLDRLYKGIDAEKATTKSYLDNYYLKYKDIIDKDSKISDNDKSIYEHYLYLKKEYNNKIDKINKEIAELKKITEDEINKCK